MSNEILGLIDIGAPSIERTEDPEYGIAEFCCPNYLNVVNLIISEPMMVDGRAWQLWFYPKGTNDGLGTHISAFLVMDSIEETL